MGLTFMSINSNRLNHPIKCKSLWQEALCFKCDVLCVQDTHLSCAHRNLCPYVPTGIFLMSFLQMWTQKGGAY